MRPDQSLDRLNAVEIDPELLLLALDLLTGARRRPRASDPIGACADAYLEYYGIEEGEAMREADVEAIGALLSRLAAFTDVLERGRLTEGSALPHEALIEAACSARLVTVAGQQQFQLLDFLAHAQRAAAELE